MLASLDGHTDNVRYVEFSADSRRLASIDHSGAVKCWESATGQEQSSVKFPSRWITGVAFGPDGRFQVAGGDAGTITVWDGVTAVERCSAKNADTLTSCVAFSPDRRRMAAAGEGNTVKVWDAESGARSCSRSEVTPTASTPWRFSPDGQIDQASTGADASVRLWDAETGRELVTFKGHTGSGFDVAFSPDGWRVASASRDGTVKVWDVAASPDVVTLKGNRIWLGGIAFSPDGRLLAASTGNAIGLFTSDDYYVKVWDVATGREAAVLGDRTTPVECVAFSPDGRRLLVGGDESPLRLQVRDLATGAELSAREFPTGKESEVSISRDGRRFVAAAPDGLHTIWDAATGREVASFRAPSRAMDLRFTPDGRRLATGHRDGSLRVWNSDTGRELLSVQGHSAFIGRVAFSPDGRRLASASADRTAKLWDAETGRQLFTLRGHMGRVDGVAFSPDGLRLASAGDDRTVKIWDASSGQMLSSLEGHGSALSFVEFSADGRRLAACANRDGSVKVWEADVPSEDLERRAAAWIVTDLFQQLGLQAEVLARLETTPDLSPSRRREAIGVARAHPDDPSVLNGLAWALAKTPGRDPADYRRALRCAEAACRLAPEQGDLLTTLGAAHVRVGEDRRALEAFERGIRIRKSRGSAPGAAELAFVAIARWRVGRAAEARESVEGLRRILEDPTRARDEESLGFLREAEAELARRDGQPATAPAEAPSPIPRP